MKVGADVLLFVVNTTTCCGLLSGQLDSMIHDPIFLCYDSDFTTPRWRAPRILEHDCGGTKICGAFQNPFEAILDSMKNGGPSSIAWRNVRFYSVTACSLFEHDKLVDWRLKILCRHLLIKWRLFIRGVDCNPVKLGGVAPWCERLINAIMYLENGDTTWAKYPVNRSKS